MASELMPPVGYAELLDQLKVRIRSARLQAALAVNRELIHLYWEIGRTILERQEREVWWMELVVMKPKRLALESRTSSAAFCHQNMTKSADSGTLPFHAERRVSV